MSLTLAIVTAIQHANPFRSTDTNPTGAAGVRAAINERGDMGTGVYDAFLGEPEIEENAGLFFTDPKIVIPIEDTKYGNAGSLVFDLPEGPEDADADFWNLLDSFDLSFSELEHLEGKHVPVKYSGGNVVVMWDQIDSGED